MHDDQEKCEYSLGITEEETDALMWLFSVIGLIHECQGGNAHRALVVGNLLARWAEHQVVVHVKIHELEDALIAKGYAKIRQPPRDSGEGEKN